MFSKAPYCLPLVAWRETTPLSRLLATSALLLLFLKPHPFVTSAPRQEVKSEPAAFPGVRRLRFMQQLNYFPGTGGCPVSSEFHLPAWW